MLLTPRRRALAVQRALAAPRPLAAPLPLRGEPIEEAALRVDLLQAALDPGQGGAQFGGLAGEVSALAGELGALGADGSDEAGGGAHRGRRFYTAGRTAQHV